MFRFDVTIPLIVPCLYTSNVERRTLKPELLDRRLLVENLSRYSQLTDLLQSPFYREHGREIESILTSPEIHSCPSTAPKLTSYVRVAQWNIEKGTQFDAILERLETDRALEWSDVILLNEADYGMLRSGNRHVALEIAGHLDMNMAFGPAYIELTKGTGEELSLKGENQESMQGNAVLSRHPILDARIIRLPACFEPYEFEEKRYGRRNCTWAKLLIGDRVLWAGSTHLEVRGTPRCRARQVDKILRQLPGGETEPLLLGGDLNTNGFPRGTRWRTLRSSTRLIIGSPGKIKWSLLHPERGSEPLFQTLENSGFSWEGLNSDQATACAEISALEEGGSLPRVVEEWIRRRLHPYGGHLQLKLDWLLGRNVVGLGDRETRDDNAGVDSLRSGCLPSQTRGHDRVSDHAPIFADVKLGDSIPSHSI